MKALKLLSTISILLLLFPIAGRAQAEGERRMFSFVEWGTAIHEGKHTPLWQTSNRHGLSSTENNTYLRAATFYRQPLGQWQLDAGLDMAVAGGFTSTLVLQQAYAEVANKWITLTAGSKEWQADLLNADLSSGGLTWSGNARPIPQLKIATSGYLQVLSRLALKAELSYGWFTDNRYQRKRVGEEYFYTRNVKYHHKGAFARIGAPGGKWLLDVGLRLDAQFGGYKTGGADEGDLGNGLRDYLKILLHQRGSKSSPKGEQIHYQGNYMGSEHLRGTLQTETGEWSIYFENYFDDLSGMGKLNGWDGLYGVEYKSRNRQFVENIVLEYYRSTHQSGPLHGLDDSVVKKTWGADDYYNNVWYPGWAHWGYTLANPLVASPIYNENGDLSFLLNRVKAMHIGCSGSIADGWRYSAKMSFNRSWGTPFRPTLRVLENFSAYVSVCRASRRWKGWSLNASLAFDVGEIYGDNLGVEWKIRKTF